MNYHQRTAAIAETATLYLNLHLMEAGLCYSAFENALIGFNKMSKTNLISNQTLLTIVDYSQSANCKRLYVLDLSQQKILFQTFVAHGINSGEEFATKFSNITGSFQSSLGFFATAQSYIGKNGLSLKLIGLDRQFNSNALSRAIVMHGADYVSEDFIRTHGRLGRSQGCTALPNQYTKPIIETISDGSCLFIFATDAYYTAHSWWLSTRSQS